MQDALLSDAELERRVGRRVLQLALVFFPCVGIINALSLITDAARANMPMEPGLPWLLELTSIAAMLCLLPLLVLYERRFPVSAEGWPRALAAHLIGSAVFSLLHVAVMVVLRGLLFWLFMDRPYAFFDDPLTDLLYEYRKDLFPYAALVLLLGLVRGVEEHKREALAARRDARDTGRLTLKSGGRTIILDAKSTEWARAAGNYAEIRAGGRTFLPRMTLTSLEQQLRAAGLDMVRVHRSHLVNRTHIAEIVPAGDGDFTVRLRDGSEIRGSRRYRDQVAA